ncbi:hypothetical protein [Nocardia pseudovaccinii]|uniref:hypothetical protein n=1 Tax=Nocardia pseudovaccinii TaxID=189540 RepID=UPI0007A47E01|nr:hypothetical protein [Nocardia pseudovaccinii]
MTGPNSPLRVRDIAPEQAALLGQIHQLSALSARLHQAVSETTPGSVQVTQLFEHIIEVDRERELSEIHARAYGMPASWVDQARTVGRSGRPWTEELLLPPTLPRTRRRNTTRVVQDTRQLADMAAITVVRELRLAANGAAEPEPAAAEQLRRNMAALWTRAAATATSIGMSRNVRGRVFNAAAGDVDQRVETYQHYSLDDLHDLWRTYTTPTIAANARRSLKSLRNADRDTDTAAANAVQPPTPRALIERARQSLNVAAINDSDTGPEIETAVTVAIPSTAHEWDASAELHGGDSIATDSYQDAGPDP